MQEEATETTVPDMQKVPIMALAQDAREPLVALNTERVLYTVDGRPRDWRGLAVLADIPDREYTNIRDHTDLGRRTFMVLDFWVRYNPQTATVGQLQIYLQTLDRFDVYYDTRELFEREADRYWKQLTTPAATVESVSVPDRSITLDDRMLFPDVQLYHAYVLHAPEDSEFGNKMIDRLRNCGLKVCSEGDLLPGLSSQTGPVSELFSNRCQHIVVIYSPDFLKSPFIKFYMDLAQALGIDSQQRKLVPIMYRQCDLPANFKFYHTLHYDEKDARPMYNFWDKLRDSLLPPNELAARRAQQATRALPAPAGPSQVNGERTAHGSISPPPCVNLNGPKKPAVLKKFFNKKDSAQQSLSTPVETERAASPSRTLPHETKEAGQDAAQASIEHEAATPSSSQVNGDRSEHQTISPTAVTNKKSTKKRTVTKIKNMFKSNSDKKNKEKEAAT